MTLAYPAIELGVLAGEYFILRLDPDADTSPFASALSITRTDRELSVVCAGSDVPMGIAVDGPWSAFYTQGVIAFGTTGVVAGLVVPLAAIGCPVFVLSTFDGDVLMVPTDSRARAVEALVAAGHCAT